MLEWNQIQAVADKLAGQNRFHIRPGDLEEPWRTLYQRIQAQGDASLFEAEAWRASEGLENRSEIAESLKAALRSVRPCHRSLADMAENLPPVNWLWPGWLPRGFLSLLGGMPGAGKSLIALDLARRAIHGLPFPDWDLLPDSAPAEPGPKRNVVYVDAESVPQILNQRAEAWGLDRSRLYLMLPTSTYDLLDLSCDRQQERLITMVRDLEPALIVIDSLGSISLKGENQVEDVRSILGFFSALAGDFDVAVLLIHHLRKRGHAAPLGPVTVDDFRGSSHIIARAASVLALKTVPTGPEPDQNGPRSLQVLKTNVAAHPAPLGVHIESGAPRAPTLRYSEAPHSYRPPTRVDQCALWLKELLREAGKPLQPRSVQALAQEAGFSRSTLYRARSQLEGTVRNTKLPHDQDNQWTL